jgi:hypothetical protein
MIASMRAVDREGAHLRRRKGKRVTVMQLISPRYIRDELERRNDADETQRASEREMSGEIQ